MKNSVYLRLTKNRITIAVEINVEMFDCFRLIRGEGMWMLKPVNYRNSEAECRCNNSQKNDQNCRTFNDGQKSVSAKFSRRSFAKYLVSRSGNLRTNGDSGCYDSLMQTFAQL